MSPVRPNDSPGIYSLRADAPEEPGRAGEGRSLARQDLIEDLRARIRRIEGPASFTAPAAAVVPERPVSGERWGLGVAAIDDLLGPRGLDPGGLHEIRSDAAGDGLSAVAATSARRIFALLLAVRRMLSLERPGAMLWCLPAAAGQETGKPYSRGLASLGLDPDRLIIATPRKAGDVPWVIEEAVKAACLSLVLGEVRTVGVTAARRLSLAAAEAQTPCLLVPLAGSIPVIAAATRWRVAPRPSGTDPLDAAAPGPRRFSIALERCRARPLVSDALDFVVEWSDAARCFGMAAAVSDRAPAPSPSPGAQPDAGTILRRRA